MVAPSRTPGHLRIREMPSLHTSRGGQVNHLTEPCRPKRGRERRFISSEVVVPTLAQVVTLPTTRFHRSPWASWESAPAT
jgi:hypothetical protein